jgi:hypothetical protein
MVLLLLLQFLYAACTDCVTRVTICASLSSSFIHTCRYAAQPAVHPAAVGVAGFDLDCHMRNVKRGSTSPLMLLLYCCCCTAAAVLLCCCTAVLPRVVQVLTGFGVLSWRSRR